MKPPNIVPPGRGKGRNIPGGYILGRTQGSRAGAVQLLDLNNLLGFGLASSGSSAANGARAGFGFFVQGMPSAGEVIGQGAFAHAVLFGTQPYTITSLIAAHATSTWLLKAIVAGVPTTVGSIVFAAGATVATLTWVGGTYTLPAGTPIQLLAPASMDSNLASVTGIVNGVRQ